MKREEAIRVLEDNRPSVIFEDKDAQKRMAELCKAIDMAIEALKDRPHGEWIVAEHQDPSDIINGNLLYICSNCCVGDLHSTKQNVPYCWNCGADMRGDTDD